MATTPDERDEAVAIAPAVTLRHVARRFWPYARPLRAWIIIGLVLVALVPAVEAIKIWLFKLVIDDVLVPKNFDRLPELALVFVWFTVVGGILSACDEMVSTFVGERFILAIRMHVFRHLHRISLIALGRRKIGDVLARLNGDIGAIEGFVIGGATDLIAYGAEVVFFTAALFLLSWDLALVSLIVIPLFYWVAERFSDLIRDASRERRRRSGSISALAEESLSNAQLVQVYDRGDHQAERYERESYANLTAALRSTKLQAIFTPLIEVIEMLGALVVIGFGSWKLVNGHLSIGALLVFLTYLSQLYGPVRGLSKLATSLHSAAAGAERVIELLDEPAAVIERPGSHRLLHVTGTLRFENVTHVYGTERVLDNVSCTIAPGTVTVIAGPNGAGKSTMARLILRLEDPTSGRVLLDNTDVRDLNLPWLRGRMGVVLQDGGAIDGTFRDNIAFGRLDATDDEIRDAAITAGIHDTIVGFADGYDTHVGARAAQLSGGHRQRLAIARALVRNAPIMVLDEPTNHLDEHGARQLVRTIRSIANDRTVIVISHDPTVIAAADHVIELSAGRVVKPSHQPSATPPLRVIEGIA